MPIRAALILSFLFIVVFCSVPAVAETKLRLAVIAPLSGDTAPYGTALKNGIILAYNRWPVELRDQLELLFEDDQMAAKNSISAFNRLWQEKRFDVLISVTSGTSNALAGLAEGAKIPFLAIATDRRISAGRSYVMNLLIRPEDQARVTADEIKRRGYRRIARFATTQDGCLALRAALDQALKAIPEVSVVIDEDYPLDTKDLKPFAMQVKGSNEIDAISAICLSGHCGLLARQLRELGITAPLFGFHMFEDEKEVLVSGGSLVGQWYVSSRDPGDQFRTDYTKQFGDKAVFWVAAHAFDSMNLIRSGLEQGHKNSETLNQFLHSVANKEGVLGTISAGQDNRFIVPVEVKTVPKLH